MYAEEKTAWKGELERTKNGLVEATKSLSEASKKLIQIYFF
jgi:hypothetical protein